MNPADTEQLNAVVDAINVALTANVLGIYQFGSAILGGLKPRSDLDVLVVIDRPTTSGQPRSLVDALLEVSSRARSRIAGRPVEVTVVRQDMVQPWRMPAEREFQYGEWLREDYESGHVPAPEIDYDLTTLLVAALAASKVLRGAPLGHLIDPVPQEDLLASMRAGVPALMGELAEDTRNVLLTLARMWYTTSTGGIVAKDAAAEWALQRMPKRQGAALAHARSVYLGEQEEAFDAFDGDPIETAGLMAAAILSAGAV